MANDFADAVEAAFERIARNPERWPRVYNEVRRYVVRHYPYLIFYEVEDNQIMIDAVAHAKRKPGYWRDRL